MMNDTFNGADVHDVGYFLRHGRLVRLPEDPLWTETIKERKNVVIYLPESFEWLVLSEGILKDGRVDKILADPAEYVESKKFFSWERFFRAVLIDETKDTYLAYAKKKLNQAYLNDTIKSSVLGQMKKIQLDKKMDRKKQVLLFKN